MPSLRIYGDHPDEVARLRYERDLWRVTTPVLSGEQTRAWGIPEPVPVLVSRLWEPLVRPLPVSDDARMLVLVTAGLELTQRFLHDPDAQPSETIDSAVHTALKANLVAHRLLDCLHDVWISSRLQRDLAGATME